MRAIVTVSPGCKLCELTKSFTHFLSLKIQRGFPVLSLGMSVSIGLGRPSTFRVIGVPRPVFLDGLPKASGGKKSLPHGLMFRLPYLRAAGVSWITHESIRRRSPFEM